MLEKGTVSDLQDRLKYLEERLKVCPRRARQKTTSAVPGALRSRGAAEFTRARGGGALQCDAAACPLDRTIGLRPKTG